MLFRRLVVFSVFLLGVSVAPSHAASLFKNQHSRLASVLGSNDFSESLLASNPWVSNKVYSAQEAFRTHIMLITKFHLDKDSFTEMRNGFPKANTLEKSAYWLQEQARGAGKLVPVVEVAAYLNRYMVLYLVGPNEGLIAGKPANNLISGGALVVGTKKVHVGIGESPICFGANVSAYPLSAPLEGTLGVAVSKLNAFLSTIYHWNARHESKLKVSRFMRGEGSEYKPAVNVSVWCAHLLHKWTPEASYIDSLKMGISGCGVLFADKVKRIAKEGGEVKVIDPWLAALDVYCHFDSGPFLVKLECVIGQIDGLERIFAFFAGHASPRPLSYAWHGEVAYNSYNSFFKKEYTVVAGYTQGMICSQDSNPKSPFKDKQRNTSFFGVKTKLIDELRCVVGLQGQKITLDHLQLKLQLAWAL